MTENTQTSDPGFWKVVTGKFHDYNTGMPTSLGYGAAMVTLALLAIAAKNLCGKPKRRSQTPNLFLSGHTREKQKG